MIKANNKYNSIGLSCLPCKLDKSPFVSGTWNKQFIDSDFINAPAIGIKCGKESGNLECIDIDNHTGNAKEHLTQLIEQIKELYDNYKFPIEETQGGGYHLIYRCEVIEGNKKLAEQPVLKNGKWTPDAIFETRGEGGYFLAYPSPGYKVIKNDIFSIPTITKEERKYILEVCKSFNTWLKPEERTEFEIKDKPGDLYNNLSESIENTISILESYNWKQISKFNWARPGKVKGISATYGRVAPGIFYVFSSNAYPFEPNKGYTPFQVMGLLEFNGDFKACAKHLANILGLEKKGELPKIIQPIIKEDDKLKMLKKAFINTDIEIEKPPVILYINDRQGSVSVYKRLFTLGNFSAIIGKAKSRKTFAVSMLTAALVGGKNLYNKFIPKLPSNKQSIVYFDTEQGLYDSANVIKRIERLSGVKSDLFYGYNIREYTPLERCELIEYALSITPNLGFVVIDGIADLGKAINDEEEATRVTGLLLKWSKNYDCHIATILHQNKNDNFATGHLGSSVMKKAEIVFSVTKDNDSSKINCDFSRGIDFNEISFTIDETGIPVIEVDMFNNNNEITYHE